MSEHFEGVFFVLLLGNLLPHSAQRYTYVTQTNIIHYKHNSHMGDIAIITFPIACTSVV